MADPASNGVVNIALFVIQIVSAASGFVIAASCLFLRKWHPPVAYTAAFHISFWIGVQAMITHTGSAISVRLPDSSEEMQRNKPMVRFLVWAQFAMPLWFVFLNAAIATDLMLSQLFQLNATKLQAVHKWYLPVTTLVAFVLALPLLIYHSAYRPESNVFSVQFPSALSVTLYYILAFDVWLAIGIVYCFVVVSIVVGVLLVKLRRKRAAWRRQNEIQATWLPVTPAVDTTRDNAQLQQPEVRQQKTVTVPTPDRLEAAQQEIEEKVDDEDSDGHIDPNQVRTFMQSLPPLPPPVFGLDKRITLPEHNGPLHTSTAAVPANPSDTLMSGVTFNEDTDIHIYHIGRPESALSEPNMRESTIRDRFSHLYKAATVGTDDPGTRLQSGSCLPLRSSKSSVGSRIKLHLNMYKPMDYWHQLTSHHSSRNSKDGEHSSRHNSPPLMRSQPETRPQRFLLKLGSLPPQLTLRSRNRSLMSSSSGSSPFRIPTLALFRLLLYPLIPIFSFTLMCVVRWVWFRSTMPSRWEILNVVSGFLRALEGFLCLIVFLLNPALNRSFREIRKRNTPVFSR
ncbi:hypothetical protein H4S02_003050 [Coemansia sp. RSA 2611]|nr:hypothetical protein H4S02_003050 [Coemansia sp. RSA 2611]